ncbi:MAG: substrate-binding periplasmic protein [Kordiimonas sp.]
MTFLRLIFLATLILTTSFASASNGEKLIKLTSTEWPPYTGENLPKQGFMTEIIRNTLTEAGYGLQVDFSAWQRSLATAYAQRNYHGTLMVYRSKDKEDNCHLTKAVAKSHLGFVQRKDTPVIWSKLEDLTGVRIGSVAGYFNSIEFDRLATEQILDVSAVFNDTLNMRRVAFGRIELAVIDKSTMHYLIKTEPSLKDYRHILEFNSTPLATHALHVCFNKTDEGRVLRDAFDKVFNPEQAKAIIENALKEY